MSDTQRRVQPRLLAFLVALGLLVPLLGGLYFWSQGSANSPETAPSAPPVTSPTPTATPTPKAKAPAAKPKPKPPAPPVDRLKGRPVNILLIGSDTREDNSKATAGRVATDQRADALFLIHVSADRKNVYGVSVMRDLWAEIPGYGYSKINDGLAFGGVPLMRETAGALFGQRIDHSILIDFGRFKGLVDALGGVRVNVTTPFTSTHDGRHTFRQGVQNLNGAQALEFVRERYAFVDGDYQRVRNQQTFLKALIAELISPKTLTNPVTLRKTVGYLSSLVPVSTGLDQSAMAGLAYSLRGVRLQDAVFLSLPTSGVGTSPDGRSIVLQDTVALAQLRSALARDRVGQFIRDRGIKDLR
ncbi:LCP family protein [Arthrobacter pascens]|uniref:LCP family protein n=1 Tax=Arthrobacter pascens TaxID=1677 RepID=UPI00196A7497|nr:LCP family protein [Arthrobacter pascens]MBN3499757.1 LCP family protein [Arthrobacter pascens]MDR6557578.1 LCP family protein required for cell wall assembly [Arthrobacter pascens]